jgi:hypothetical protein
LVPLYIVGSSIILVAPYIGGSSIMLQVAPYIGGSSIMLVAP